MVALALSPTGAAAPTSRPGTTPARGGAADAEAFGRALASALAPAPTASASTSAPVRTDDAENDPGRDVEAVDAALVGHAGVGDGALPAAVVPLPVATPSAAGEEQHVLEDEDEDEAVPHVVLGVPVAPASTPMPSTPVDAASSGDAATSARTIAVPGLTSTPGMTPKPDAATPGASRPGMTSTPGASTPGTFTLGVSTMPGIVAGGAAAPSASGTSPGTGGSGTEDAGPAAGTKADVPVTLVPSVMATAAPTTLVTAPIDATPTVAPVPRTFVEQLSRPVLGLAVGAPGEHVMTLRVSPEHLGPVTVQAHIGSDGVRLELFCSTDAGRAAVHAVLNDLRRDLAGTGLGASLDLSDRGAPLHDPSARHDSRDGDARDRGSGAAGPPAMAPPDAPARHRSAPHAHSSSVRLDVLV